MFCRNMFTTFEYLYYCTIWFHKHHIYIIISKLGSLREGLVSTTSKLLKPLSLVQFVKCCMNLGVRYIFLYAFMIENIQEGIKCKLKAGNSCYYSVQTLLSSRLLSKNLKIYIKQ